MKKGLVNAGVFAFWMLLVFNGDLLASDHKTTELNHKINEISSLRENISAKIAQAVEMRGQLNEQRKELIEEIKQEKDRLHLSSYQQAVQSLRIDYDLRLIQRLSGYIARLDERIRYFENADKTLDYYFKQTKDDLLIIKTLNDFEVDKLVREINLVLDEYIPQTKGPMMSVENIPTENPEDIWNKMIRN